MIFVEFLTKHLKFLCFKLFFVIDYEDARDSESGDNVIPKENFKYLCWDGS